RQLEPGLPALVSVARAGVAPGFREHRHHIVAERCNRTTACLGCPKHRKKTRRHSHPAATNPLSGKALLPLSAASKHQRSTHRNLSIRLSETPCYSAPPEHF